MKFEIKHRFSAKVLFEAELSAEFETQSYRVQLGAAVKKAVEAKANLTGANLTGANLAGAYLADANLADANLAGAKNLNLDPIKQDLIAEVLKLPHEIDALRAALVAGKIDGSTYSGECACLAGTLAKAHGVSDGEEGENIACGKVTFRTNAQSPRERWFMSINPGDTPDNSNAAKLALEWIDEAIAIRDNILAMKVAA